MSGNSVTLYRFRIDLSDVDRGVYNALDFRIARHPSESLPYLLTRVFAYALNWQKGLEFSPQGLGDPEGPAIFISAGHEAYRLWIEIGNPSARKLHKASKACSTVKVYTYKDPQYLLREASSEKIHKAEQIEIFAFKNDFLEHLALDLPKEVRMNLLHNDGLLDVSFGSTTAQGEMKKYKFD